MGMVHLGCLVRRSWGRRRSSVRGVSGDGGDVEVVGSGSVEAAVDAVCDRVGEVGRRCAESGSKDFGLELGSWSGSTRRTLGHGGRDRG